MPDHRGDLWIVNTVSDRIQGDVLGLRPTISGDNRVVQEVRV